MVDVYAKTNKMVFDGSKAFGSNGILVPAALTANANNYNPTNWQDVNGEIQRTLLHLQTDGSGNKGLRGLLASTTATRNIVTITNIGSVNNINVVDSAASSAAANRFLLNGNQIIAPLESASFYYDITIQRWRPMSDYK